MSLCARLCRETDTALAAILTADLYTALNAALMTVLIYDVIILLK